MKKRSVNEEREITRISRLYARQEADELRLNPGYQAHEHLLQIVTKLPTDYEPFGQMENDDDFKGDCSGGCRWYHLLAGRAGHDWGVCTNPASPRVGLLTFEHQGCSQFDLDPRWEFLNTAEGRKARQRFYDREDELRKDRERDINPRDRLSARSRMKAAAAELELRLPASTEIARFDEISVRLFYVDYEQPLVYAVADGATYTLTIPGANAVEGSAAGQDVQERIAKWFGMLAPIPGSPPRRVASLVYDQWLRVRNRQPAEKVPTPDQVKLMSQDGDNEHGEDVSIEDYYAIERALPLPDYRLKIFFRNGQVRVADIKAMWGSNPQFKEAFLKFDQVQIHAYFVSWEVADNTIEIEDQDLWGAGLDAN